MAVREKVVEPSAVLALRRAESAGADAFRSLFLEHSGAVHRFLKDLLRDEPLADEGVQETFVRAHERLGTLEHRERVLGWLLGIARNVSLELRRARRRDGPAEGPEPADRACTSPNPEHVLLGREEMEVVERAMAGLSEDKRAALLLRFDHGLPYEEIASTLGWTLSKAKVEVHRARLKLRAALDQANADASGEGLR
ncbi:MAG TPA: RNA polymerase sigma factor [Myxococcales bacterium]|nr:RNA polymerase sigma factor [Myxococcales bacterium]